MFGVAVVVVSVVIISIDDSRDILWVKLGGCRFMVFVFGVISDNISPSKCDDVKSIDCIDELNGDVDVDEDLIFVVDGSSPQVSSSSIRGNCGCKSGIEG